MKYMICVLLTLLSFSLLAVIRTVDNNNPSAGQYSTVQAAIDAANNDDIIYVYPSNTAYAGFNVNKRLKIYGVGWQGTTASIRKTMISSDITMQAGAENSVISGFQCTVINNTTVTGSVIFENCVLNYLGFSYPGNDYGNYFMTGCKIIGASPWNWWLESISQQTGLTITNCIFIGNARLAYNIGSNLTIHNSYIQTSTTLFQSTSSIPNIRNSYIIATGYTNNASTFPSDAVIAYNMSSTALFPTGTTNQNNIPLSSVFDSLFHPLPGSPAIDAGDPAVEYNDLDGSRNDIGAFGGPCPFDENGYTTLPTITDISGTLYTSPSQGLQIHVEASSRH